MPRPRKTDAEIQEMRNNILDATLEILKNEGIDKVTSRAIAGKLGIAHMSLFTYFENQGAILAALRDRIVANVCIPLDAIVARSDSESISNLVEEVWRLIFNYSRQNPSLHRLTWAVADTKKIDTKPAQQKIASRIANLLEQGMSRGEFVQRDPQIATMTVVGMLHMPFVLQYTGQQSDSVLLERLVEEGLTAAMAYLKKG